jgi:mannose-6-phosphate isomerase
MYILQQVLHPTVWGGTRLNKYTDEKIDNLGHLYLVNGHQQMSNVILNGVDAGRTLNDVFPERKCGWNLSEYEEFPLTVALVDASDNLSIQVHPDDVSAERLEGRKIGKTESWLFLEAPVSGWIYDGCTLENRNQVEQAVSEGRMEEITGRLQIKKNDYVCVEAGTLHAMTAGSLVYEIEYGSDFTYRFYDYDRRDKMGNTRELHVEKALLSIKPEIVSRIKHDCKEEWLSEEAYEIRQAFDLSYYKNEGSEIECLSVISGEGVCENTAVHGGMSILLFPNEELKNIRFEYAVIARLRR